MREVPGSIPGRALSFLCFGHETKRDACNSQRAQLGKAQHSNAKTKRSKQCYDVHVRRELSNKNFFAKRFFQGASLFNNAFLILRSGSMSLAAACTTKELHSASMFLFVSWQLL